MKTLKFGWGAVIFFVGAGVVVGGGKIALEGVDMMYQAMKELVQS